MRRGVADADFVLAVVSPSYIKSKNCGCEMAFAHEFNTAVVPIVLGVPFAEWPPTRIGQTDMDHQFATKSGDNVLKYKVQWDATSSFADAYEVDLEIDVVGSVASVATDGVVALADPVPYELTCVLVRKATEPTLVHRTPPQLLKNELPPESNP